MGRTLTNTLMALSTLLLCAACVDDMTGAVSADGTAQTTPTTYLQINFTAHPGNSTRAYNPLGGENGNDTETGQDNENKITSADIFLYKSNQGVNEPDGSTAVTLVEFNDEDFSSPTTTGDNGYITITSSTKDVVGISRGTYHILAVANPIDDLSGLGTLDDVREYIEKKAWNDTYESFLMSSANDDDASVYLDYNTEANPAQATVEVERMAARVDYRTSSTSLVVDDYPEATVKITGAALVNNLNAGSYLLKRVSTGKDGTVTYLGEEEIDEEAVYPENTATNYVIDPWTDDKGYSSTITIDGETKTIADIYEVYYPGYAYLDEQQNPSYWKKLMKAGDEITVEETGGEEVTWNRIGYTMENTTYQEKTSKEYATGVVFGATFYPASGTVEAGFYDGFTYDYDTPGTFFKWNGTLYATLEDVMAAAYPSTPQFTTDKFENTITSCSTWGELTAFAESLRDDDPTGYKAYLLGLAEGHEGTDEFAYTAVNDVLWEDFVGDKCGYKYDESKNEVNLNQFIDTKSYDTRAILARLSYNTLSTYEDGRCYYTWWIRHCNNGNDKTNGVMEYAIVRNNIYKLTVTSVSTIGGDIPQEGIQVDVTVKDWVYDSETHDETVDM